jgi:predicted exporter
VKKPSLPFKAKRFSPPLLWLLFHAGPLLALGISVLAGFPLSIQGSLFSLLPQSSSAAAPGDKVLASRTSRNFIILTGSGDFSGAREGAVLMYEGLAPDSSGFFETLSLYMDADAIKEFTDYLYRYRYVLLDRETRELLESGGAGGLASDALASAYGAFSLTGMENLEGDPFFLSRRSLLYFLSVALEGGGGLSPREDVPAIQRDGTWYVLIQGTMSGRGASVANSRAGAGEIYALGKRIEESIPGLKFYYSGVPFHSYESSTNARKEISLISTAALIIITILFLYVFRSVLPVLSSVLAIAASILLGLTLSLLCFREIHILSFVFGTTLIGICADYSIHFFVHWKGNIFLKDSGAVGRAIFPSVTMSFLSSELCFAALFFAPFPILKQFAVFSGAGLLSSYLTVTCLYPLLKLPAPEKRRFPLPAFPGYLPSSQEARLRAVCRKSGISALLRPGLFLVMAVLALAVVFFRRDRVRVENNISGLYTMTAALRESEVLSAAVMNRGTAPWYFIVAGDNPEELLEHEEALTERLDAEKAAGNMGSYMAVSAFVPSLKTQERNYNASRVLLPLAEAQFTALGFPALQAERFLREFESLAGRYSAVEKLPAYIGNMLSNLWIGEEGGRYYSCVLPVNAKDEECFRAIAEDLDSVFFMNKAADIGKELDRLTRTMIALLLVAYACIVITVFFRYRHVDALCISAVPFVLALTVLAVLAAADTALGFFPMVGLILVFGLGLDYMFYSVDWKGDAAPELRSAALHDGAGKQLAKGAIVLSYVTTALSFGALVLSSFAPVHVFGLTVFAGVSSAFISAMLIGGGFSSGNQRTRG